MAVDKKALKAALDLDATINALMEKEHSLKGEYAIAKELVLAAQLHTDSVTMANAIKEQTKILAKISSHTHLMTANI